MAVTQVHLLPHTGYLIGVKPLVVSRPANVIKMVIHAVTSCPWLLPLDGKLAYIAPVVITEKQSHVFRNIHALIVIVLYLFVQGPHLRCLAGGFSRDLFYDPALVINDLLQQVYVSLGTHGLVSVSPHPHGNDAFIVAFPFHAFLPEISENQWICLVIPPTGAVTCPFHMGSHHGFMMGGSYDNAIFIGQARIFRVIVVEGPSPHGRPQKITPHPEDVFKYVFVKPAVERSITFMHPARKGRCLVVDENAPVPDCRFSGSIFARHCIQVFSRGYWHIGPEM